MSAIRDARHITTAEDDAARRIARWLAAVVVILTAYSCVADIPERQVVMSREAFEKRLQDERIKAARAALDAKECLPGDEFRYPPRALKRFAQK